MNYPPGTSIGDPRAPWNDREWDACEDCAGEGTIYDQVGTPLEKCHRCDGEGVVPPPTAAEIAEHKAERDFDVRHEEGEL